MNRTFERISLMLIGAIPASAGYFIGAADSEYDAKPIGSTNGVFETFRCQKLIVGASESEHGVVIGRQGIKKEVTMYPTFRGFFYSLLTIFVILTLGCVGTTKGVL